VASTKYDFTIASAFPSGKVDPDKFTAQIRASAITTALDYVATDAGICSVWFKAALSGGEQTTLNAVVAAHDGIPDEPPPLAVREFVAPGVPAPVATDGKPFVLPNSFPGEVLLNFTGCSDALSPATRFEGALFGVQQVGVGDTSQTIDLLDGVFLAGGHIDWVGGSWGCFVYFELVAPASTVKAPASPGTGNCNLVPTGLGFNIIVPAAGNGAYDLDAPIPIPAFTDETNQPNGYWSYSEPWVGKGTVSPGSPGASKYNLFDVPLELAHFAKIHLFRSEGQRDLIAPAIKPKWILPEWKMKVSVHNAGSGTLSVAWDLLIARRKSV
jgi:hypothetical protein